MAARAMVVFLLLSSCCCFLVSCGGGNDRSQAAPGETAQEAATPRQPSDEELQADVPELVAFHEVIFQLWHQAWPEKDYETMVALLPAVRENVEILQQVELPGIARDKQAAWDEGMAQLTESLDAYEAAAAAEDQEGLLLSVEQLHTNFENLVRIMRPLMDEIEAYHLELYRAYHYYLPDENLLEIRLTAARMTDRCAELLEASPPPASGVDPEAFVAAVEALCESTEELQRVSEGEDWAAIGGAVERVHDRYRKIVEMFD